MARDSRTGPVCPNCGNHRLDRFCGRCGQNDRDYVRGLWSVVCEFFREMFELDSRLFRTLKSLLFKPGHLSSEFSRNRRAAYMSPVRLYLFTSFLFFLVLSISAGGWLSNLDRSDATLQVETGDEEENADGVVAAVDSALAARGPPAAPGVGAAAADALVDSTLAVLSRAGQAREPAADQPDTAVGDEAGDAPVPPGQLEAFKARLRPEHARKVDDILGRPDGSMAKRVVRGLVTSAGADEPGGWLGWLLRYGRGLVIDLFHDPEDFLQQAIGNLPVAMFFLLPVFAMILAVCYLRRKRFFVEHLVFGMHIHTFVFLTLAAALLVPGEAAGNWVELFFVVVSPLYVLIAMRRFYGEGWRWTLVKGFVVWNLYSFVLFPGLLLAFLIRT